MKMFSFKKLNLQTQDDWKEEKIEGSTSGIIFLHGWIQISDWN